MGSINCMRAKMNGVQVHEHTNEPDVAWRKLQKQGSKCVPVAELPLDTPIATDKVRFVCISDTHNRLASIAIPNGDVLLHAGDFTGMGSRREVAKFNDELAHLPHRHKIVIAGNHELSFDKNTTKRYSKRQGSYNDSDGKNGGVDPRSLLTNCTYLEDSGIEVHGIKIYGSPYQPEFHGWAFNKPRGQTLLDIWNQIPVDTDILITHGPPVGHGDISELSASHHCGCVELLTMVEHRVRPRYHLFGHIHEDRGVTTNNVTTFINASICTTSYKATQLPIIFDMQLPDGVIKT